MQAVRQSDVANLSCEYLLYRVGTNCSAAAENLQQGWSQSLLDVKSSS